MKLKEYVRNLIRAINKNPELADLIVVYAHDKEKVSVSVVEDISSFDDNVGNFESGDFIFIDEFQEYELDKDIDVNAICVNL